MTLDKDFKDGLRRQRLLRSENIGRLQRQCRTAFRATISPFAGSADYNIWRWGQGAALIISLHGSNDDYFAHKKAVIVFFEMATDEWRSCGDGRSSRWFLYGNAKSIIRY
ncbi:MAG: hypothetical protein ABI171_13715 [Collimonas sp.]|uniref:hypothetical protein n=1 Tax=Collimonas sp. TaxID=1963772 RepID=UPI003267A07F